MASVEDDIVISCIRMIVVKTCSTAATLVNFTCKRILDFLGLIFNVVALCTVIRAYPLIHTLCHYSDDEKWRPWVWRGMGILQLLIFIMDIPFAIMLLLETVFFWRLILMIKDHRENTRSKKWFQSDLFDSCGFIGIELRLDILKSFLGLLTDIFIIPFAIILFFSWRSVIVYTELRYEKSDFHRKRIILFNSLLLFVDMFVFLMFLIQIFSWRMTVIFHITSKTVMEYKDYREVSVIPIDAESNKINLKSISKIQWNFRRRVFYNFLRLIPDILMLPIIILLLFSWRAPVLFKKCITFNRSISGARPCSRWKAELDLRGGIMTHFLRYCIDLLMLVPLLIVLCSWRFPILILKFKRFFGSSMQQRDELKLRWALLFHTFQVLIDVVSIPPMIITLFSWRLTFFIQIFPLNTYKSAARKFNKVRLQFWIEALSFLLDIPVIIALLLTMSLSWCFPWRLKQIFAFLSDLKNTTKSSSSKEWWVNDNQSDIRSFILGTLIYVLCDLFLSIFAVIIVITLWRLPFLINEIIKIKRERCDTHRKSFERSFDYHTAVFKQFGFLFIDFALFLFLIVIFGTLWRVKPMVRKIKKHAKKENSEQKENDDDDEEDEEVIIPSRTLEITLDNWDEPEDHVQSLDAEKEVYSDGEGHRKINVANMEIEDLSVEVVRAENKDEELKSNCLDLLFKARGWKIRKAIVINTVGLLLDIPSFVMLIINLAFIYQIPFIIQRFLECGDFYQEFFFIMVDETSHLLQDIAFFLIFVFLTLVRPVFAWVNILEDKNHFKAKKSQEYLSVIQQVIKQRGQIQNNIESVFSVFVKYHQLYATSPDSVTKRFIDEENVYLEEIKQMRDKLLDEELDDELIYLMANIHFYESKQPYLLTRKYKIEEMYCFKACVAARNHNFQMCTTEIKVVEEKLEEMYSKVENLKINKLPLWTGKVGFLQRTRRQNQRVIIKTMTSGYFGIIALFLMNCLFIYRIPVMIRNMLMVSYCRFRVRDVVLTQTKEYLLDWLAILKVLLVVLSVYRCPALISDLFHDIFSKRSLSAARKTVDKYPVNIINDILDLLGLLLSWDTVIFCVAFVLFVVLIPLSVVINTIRALKLNIFVVFLLAIPLYGIIMAGPFVIVHKVAAIVLSNSMDNYAIIPYAIVGFMGFIIVILIAFVIIQTKNLTNDDKHVKSIDYIRYNWFNAQVVFLEILEVVQLLALLFSIRNLAVPYAEQIRTVSQYILLDVYDYMTRLGVSVVIFAAWVMICTVPSLLEGVTKKVPKGHFSNNHFVWRSFLSFFGVTLFITLPEMSMSFLACNYSNCSNATVCPSLIEDPDVACWSGSHFVIASITFFMMIWYVFTSMLFCMQYTDVSNKKVDLQFSSPYSALVNLAKLILVICISIFHDSKIPVLGFVSTMMVILMITSLTFPTVTGMAVCNAKALLIWRIETFFVVLVFSLGLLTFEVINISNTYKEWYNSNFIFNGIKLIDFAVPLTVLIVTLTSLLVAFILSKYFTEISEQEKARSEFKKIARNIIKPKVKEHRPVFIPHWKKVCKPYTRMLDVVRVAHKNDKSFEEPLEKYVPLDDIPPPAYDPDLLYLPPPPSYDAISNIPDFVGTQLPSSVEADSAPVAKMNCSGNSEETNMVTNTTKDEYFLPSPAMYLNPIGVYKDFDATEILKKITLRNPNPGGIFKTGWIMDETVPGAKEKQLTDIHCTGIDLLLLLEEHICYTSLSYEFVTSLPKWRDEVKQSNWIGLRDCVLKLRDNLTATYTKPKDILKADKTDLFTPHIDTSHLPAYVPLSDITHLKLKLHKQGVEKLMGLITEPWVSIFGKILPSSDSDEPLIYKVTLGSKDENNLYNIRVEMFKELEIIVKGVEPIGFKAAIGASIVLPNPIVISKLRKGNKRIHFGEPYPYGKKGMLSKKITSCSTKLKNGTYSLVAAGKSVKLTKVLASLAELEWRFID